MTDLEKNIDLQQNQILHIVKIAALFFSAVAFFQYRISTGLSDIFRASLNTAIIMACALLFVLLVYTIWSILNSKVGNSYIYRTVVEPTIFLSIAFISVILTGAENSNYKYLFIFVIVSSSIECGMRASTCIAGISSIIVLGIDLICSTNNEENNFHFESDLVLICAFLIIAWTISFYVRMEKSHIETLKGLVNLDGLTGLYNHRYFYESLKRTMEAARSEKTDLALLFIDIDYFKNYNDINGHQRGDEVLKNLAKILTKNTRADDIVSRYGGEEFSVILPNTSEEEALRLAEHLRQTVQEENFPGQEYMPAKNLTISVGVAAYTRNAKMNVDDIVKNADEALYKAKFLRKNRVERYYSILDDLQNSVANDDREIIISIKTLIAVIDAKDKYTFGHVERVVSYCLLIADQLGFDEKTKRNLIYAAYMHDIGKINIPEDILLKVKDLVPEEWAILKEHPQKAVEIIKNVAELKEVAPIILQHHEKFDGTGYPNGLKGDDIIYLARVLTVVDCFDAMTSDRPYQQKKTIFEAFDELIRCGGTHFDPDIVQAFIHTVVEKMEKIK